MRQARRRHGTEKDKGQEKEEKDHSLGTFGGRQRGDGPEWTAEWALAFGTRCLAHNCSFFAADIFVFEAND